MNKITLHRMALVAGIERTNSEALDEMIKITTYYLKRIIEYASIYAEYFNRKTIMASDVTQAIEKIGFAKLYEIQKGKHKRCHVSHEKNPKKRMKEYQRQFDCFYISKTGFEKTVKTISKKEYSIRWSEDALFNMQIEIEHFIIKMFKLGRKLMIHSKRVTLYPEDLELTAFIIQDSCKFNQ